MLQPSRTRSPLMINQGQNLSGSFVNHNFLNHTKAAVVYFCVYQLLHYFKSYCFFDITVQGTILMYGLLLHTNKMSYNIKKNIFVYLCIIYIVVINSPYCWYLTLFLQLTNISYLCSSGRHIALPLEFLHLLCVVCCFQCNCEQTKNLKTL